MFYEPKKANHGLPYDPFKACVVPRPIGWISTVGPDGVPNLAPYSQFQNLTFDPPYVMFAANQTTDGRRKDSTVNAEQTGEFVYNMATYALREAVNLSAQQVLADVDEFELAGVTKAPSKLVRAPRVAESPIQFECLYHQTLRLPGNSVMGTVDVVIGQVIGVHIRDEFIGADGKLNIIKIRPIARLGYYDYSSVESIFEMIIPGNDEKLRLGMEGSKTKISNA
ncbi:MAG: flavin reductase family protein [Deltaproteobacteria bacterium]|nr:flavin reductase family protein [Deltaproteobacteria bacterium]